MKTRFNLYLLLSVFLGLFSIGFSTDLREQTESERKALELLKDMSDDLDEIKEIIDSLHISSLSSQQLLEVHHTISGLPHTLEPDMRKDNTDLFVIFQKGLRNEKYIKDSFTPLEAIKIPFVPQGSPTKVTQDNLPLFFGKVETYFKEYSLCHHIGIALNSRCVLTLFPPLMDVLSPHSVGFKSYNPKTKTFEKLNIARSVIVLSQFFRKERQGTYCLLNLQKDIESLKNLSFPFLLTPETHTNSYKSFYFDQKDSLKGDM